MRLSSERLLLREFRSGDEHHVHVYASDPTVTQYMHWGPNSSLAVTREHVEPRVQQGVVAGDSFTWAVTVHGDDRVIGSIELRLDSHEHRRADFGYVYARDVWGHGYATEAAILVRNLAFDTVGMHRLWATCHPENRGLARVLEKTGLTLEGRLRDHQWVRGAWRDSLLYAAINPSDDVSAR